MRYANVVVLTGAGVSAESGVATFRDPGGVWARYDYREVATPEGFAANPDLVHEFYNARRAGLADVEPNAAHYALAAWERAQVDAGGAFTLVTQNVDDLHQRAGSTAILAMHGSLVRSLCGVCGDRRDCRRDLAVSDRCAACGARGAVRPDVVWFGETPYLLDEIDEAMAGADLFVSIGTSGAVYPAAGLVAQARALGVATVELNLEPSDNASLFSAARYGPASVIVPAFVDAVLNDRFDGA
ncbi:MAG: NAD-dependent deacylase [Pseudomonadota bacterium]